MFNAKLFTTAVAVGMLAAQANAAVREITDADDMVEVMMDMQIDFAVYSLYKPSDPSSVEIDDLVTKAEAYFNEKIASSEWSPRTVGWLRIDLEANPEAAGKVNHGNLTPDQVLLGRGQNLQLQAKRHHEDVADDVEDLARAVHHYTGDWASEISCDEIGGMMRPHYDQVVLFATAEDLEADPKYALLKQASLSERFNFATYATGFHANREPECREKYGLEDGVNYIGFFNGDLVPHKIHNWDEINIQLTGLLSTISIRAQMGTPLWNEQAYTSLMQWKHPAILYMSKGKEIDNSSWKLKKFDELVQYVSNLDEDFSMMKMPFEQDLSEDTPTHVPDLAPMIGITEDMTDNLFFLHPLTGTLSMFPEVYALNEEISAEFIYQWAQFTRTQIDIQEYDKDLAKAEELKAKGEWNEEDEEQFEKVTARVEELKTFAQATDEILAELLPKWEQAEQVSDNESGEGNQDADAVQTEL